MSNNEKLEKFPELLTAAAKRYLPLGIIVLLVSFILTITFAPLFITEKQVIILLIVEIFVISTIFGVLAKRYADKILQTEK